MIFNSAPFLILLAILVPLYYALPYRRRNLLLLAASCVFYMAWRPEYILLILFSTGVDWLVCLRLEQTRSPSTRRGLLAVSLVSNLGLLFFFKYFHFACDSLRAALGLVHVSFVPPALEILLPVGISFYTFQALSYTIDVYRGILPAERRFPTLFLYVMFFPQLVAGPIERSTSLMPQFAEKHDFDERRAADGCRLIAWGLIKKMVIADRLALLVEPVYADPAAHAGLPLLLATYAFAFQIYCDFSGYSDIAIGTAKLLGFRLMDNFKAPYFSASIAEFWHRWHISLSTWFRDYVYIPLGGARVSMSRAYANLLVTFVLSGLWHGAKWTFVLWGLYHGLLLALSRAAKGGLARIALPSWAKGLVVFHLVVAGWVLFRANTLPDALFIFRHALDSFDPGPFGRPSADLLIVGAVLPLVLLIEALGVRQPFLDRAAKLPAGLRGALDVAAVLVVANLGCDAEVPFIYFQF